MNNKTTKTVIVINGAGGVGKDTLCEIASEKFRVKNISSITPIKEIGRLCGWQGEKTDKARKFLADLKMVCVEYNDYPTLWAKGEYEKFLESDEELMFVHIREPEEIKKFVSATGGVAKTMLVRGGERTKRQKYGNAADDCVENYAYDYYFDNDKTLEEARDNFLSLLERIIL
jgi:cytidylate kinase